LKDENFKMQSANFQKNHPFFIFRFAIFNLQFSFADFSNN